MGAVMSVTTRRDMRLGFGCGYAFLNIGDERFVWSRGDTFVAPSWHAIGHRAASDAQLFALSDEPLLRFSNYYRFAAAE